MNSRSLKTQNGVALLAVLAVSVVLSLLIASASVLMQKQLFVGLSAQQQFKDKVQAHKKTQELVYLLATQRITRAGVSRGKNESATVRVDGQFTTFLTGDEVRVDGYKYTQELEGTNLNYSIQAADGLIPINTNNQHWLKLWLKSYKLDDFNVAKLTDHLADYADEDTWARAAGAEEFSYRNSSLDEPTNFLFQTCSELNNVLLWGEIIEKLDIDLSQCSTERSPTMNLNAIPEKLLARLFPVHQQQLLSDRLNGVWLMSESEASSKVPYLTSIDSNLFSITSRRTFHITVETPNLSKKLTIKTGVEALPPFTLHD